uniref:Nudix hydrolase domain-containing protein n=1 Tax=Kalanchoe fedtschenkoi TaxID=63787 RepID=A0A7N0UBF7_KALFE
MMGASASLYRPARSLHLRFQSAVLHRSFASSRVLHRLPPLSSVAGASTGRKVRSFGYGWLGNSRLMSSEVTLAPVEAAEEIEKLSDFLDGELDGFGGVIISITQPMESGDFVKVLRASMARWKLQGKKGVWIRLPIEHANLVEAAVKAGFWYHHAEPNYLMLVHWIPDTPNTLPANASHQVLVVLENNGKFKGTGVWKFPTGVVEEGEDICDAARREVKEETGIEAEFIEVLAFRQSHQAFFGKSDIFFVCMLRPISHDIQIQESEIGAAKWMPFHEYAAQPSVMKRDLLSNIMRVCSAKIHQGYAGFTPVSTASAFSDKKHFLYLNGRDLNKL